MPGYNAKQLHEEDPEVVALSVKAATRRLLQNGGVEAICLGCAGMADMDSLVREACLEELGVDEGSRIWIVDGFQAAVELIGEKLLLAP